MPLLGTLARVLKWPCQASRMRGGPEASRARPQRTSWDMGESLDLLLHLMGSLWRLKQVVLNLVCSLKGWLWIPGRERKKGVKSGIVYTSRRPRTHRWHKRTACHGWWVCMGTEERSDPGVFWRWCRQDLLKEDEGEKKSPTWLLVGLEGWWRHLSFTGSAISWLFSIICICLI